MLTRFARFAYATTLLIALLADGAIVRADPLSDVNGSNWAYQAIQSLSADGIVEGYPDGTFRGDRPMSRQEMAVLVARAVAHVQADGASKADIQKVQRLIDALKDELDGLGVRTTNLEESLQTLDARTRAAQAISVHADFRPNFSQRQDAVTPHTISGGPADPFVTTFLQTDWSNNFFDPSMSGVQLRYNDNITLGYRAGDNLQITIPIRILSYQYGGPFGQQEHFGIEPGIDVSIAKLGTITNLTAHFGELDYMPSSLTGLAFRAPDNAENPSYGAPLQPYLKGLSFSGRLNGTTDIFFSAARVDPTLLYSSNATGLLDPSGYGTNTILFPVTPPQGGYLQIGAPGGGASLSQNFTAGGSGLQQVSLNSKAILGTVYISSCDGTLFNSAGQATGGAPASGICAGIANSFTFNDAYNSVTFASPLPPGTRLTVQYTGVTGTNNTAPQRYMITGRVVQQLRSLPGGSIGLTYNRIFDYDDSQAPSAGFALGSNGAYTENLISDTVFGLDFQLPLALRSAMLPTLYAEAASSIFNPSYRNLNAPAPFESPTRFGSALVAGFRFRLGLGHAQVQYQSVGANYISGAPFRYYGNAPNLFAYYQGAFFPGFFGLANNLRINQQLDAAANFSGGLRTATNSALTYAYPIFDPFQAYGPNDYSAFVPNTQGISANLSAPVRIGGLHFDARVGGEHLQEVQPNSYAAMQFCGTASPNSACPYFSIQPESENALSAGTTFHVNTLGRAVTLDLSGRYEQLSRNDTTAFPYVPWNPATQSFDAGTTAALPAGISPVTFAPNYVGVSNRSFNAQAAVPLTRDLTLSVQYNTQHYEGAYGQIGSNIDERKDYYLGNLTYNIPKTNSAITFSARQYRYQDAFVPTYNLTQNREDLNFTVKF
ncbi:MAG: S-layer homology domain-containing protein [Candidatus Baltobacteraceae bacterium]